MQAYYFGLAHLVLISLAGNLQLQEVAIRHSSPRTWAGYSTDGCRLRRISNSWIWYRSASRDNGVSIRIECASSTSFGYALLEPAHEVAHHFVAICFVQHLVPAFRIIFLADVRDSRRAISLGHRLQPFEAVINRVLVAGENVDRKVLANLRERRRID